MSRHLKYVASNEAIRTLTIFKELSKALVVVALIALVYVGIVFLVAWIVDIWK